MTHVPMSQGDLFDIMERRESLEMEFDLDKALLIFLECQNNLEELNSKLSLAFRQRDYAAVKRLIALVKYEQSLREAAEDKVLSLGGSF